MPGPGAGTADFGAAVMKRGGSTLIVGGGELTADFLRGYLAEHPGEFIIAADRGLELLLECGAVPDLVVGDFDSLRGQTLLKECRRRGVAVRTFPAEKDYSDGEAAIYEACEMGSGEITMLGGCGGRLDHFLSNLMNLQIPLKKGIPAYLVDEQNTIFLADRPFQLTREEAAGRYVSLLPLTDVVSGLTLRGLKYPLTNHELVRWDASLGVSNELIAKTAEISFSSGILIVVLSRDRTAVREDCPEPEPQ